MSRSVLFSPEGLLSQRRGGVTRSFCEIARALADDAGLGWQPCLFTVVHGNVHLRDLARERRGPRPTVLGRYLPLPGELRPIACRWAERRLLSRLASPPSVVHDTGYRFAAESSRDVPVVITVHDLINDESPEYRASRAAALREKAAAIARARRIVVPSAATRDSLVRVHRVEPERIDVIHHGARMPAPGDRDPIGRPYLLHVGGRGGYKDFPTAMRAFARLRSSGFDGPLVNVGGGPLRHGERALAGELGLPPGSIVVRDADDRELATLYAFASALAVPSRIEGFGMPILEAMSLGCPVACMDAPGCAEVAGDAAPHAPVGDDAVLAEQLARILQDPAERSLRVERGLLRAARLTWAESARKHAACYERAA